MDLEIDNEKVNKPLFPSPEPSVSWIDDLDFFKDFENEFPAIVYNDALTSKLDFTTEPTFCPQHIDKFDMKDEHHYKGNDDNEIDMIQSSKDMALPPRDQRCQYLRFEGLQYTEGVIADFETRLDRIYRRKAPEKVTVTDLFYLRGLDVGSINIPYLLVRYLRRFAAKRKSEALISGVDVEASMVPGGGVEDVKMPQAVPPPPRTQGERIAILEEEVHGMREALQGAVCLTRDIHISESPVEYERRTRIKPGNKFSIVVHEYVTKTSMLSKSRAELRRESVYKSVEAEEKFNLKFS
uniref:Uncharacterized protein n=1 Tax=Tanacetum cinerariifolium TaxID=118510 RepID=A0A6L2MEK7_TANCI|nr:hypothetical protein [Tanacetum cinerariifolium]